jgi:hypothetical protein
MPYLGWDTSESNMARKRMLKWKTWSIARDQAKKKAPKPELERCKAELKKASKEMDKKSADTEAPGKPNMKYYRDQLNEARIQMAQWRNWAIAKNKAEAPEPEKPDLEIYPESGATGTSDKVVLDPYIGARLIEEYLHHDSDLHVRRTLDQFFYDYEEDTDARDTDQVVYNYTNEHLADMPGLNKKPILIMVDQLWLWVLQDAVIRRVPHLVSQVHFLTLTATVVTSFPSLFEAKITEEAKKDEEAEKNDKAEKKKEVQVVFREQDLFECVKRDLWIDSLPEGRPLAQSPLNLASTIVKKAATLLISKTLPYHKQFLFMYENQIAISVSFSHLNTNREQC